jgi:plastocyanin
MLTGLASRGEDHWYLDALRRYFWQSCLSERNIAVVQRGANYMAIPRILFVVPGLLAGLLIPALASPHSAPATPTTVGMTNGNFAKTTVYLHEGQRLTLFNDSPVVHVIGPGTNQHVVSPERGNPMTGFHLMQTNSSYTTSPWNTIGTFYLTCSVHTGMNLTVIVVR